MVFVGAYSYGDFMVHLAGVDEKNGQKRLSEKWNQTEFLAPSSCESMPVLENQCKGLCVLVLY